MLSTRTQPRDQPGAWQRVSGTTTPASASFLLLWLEASVRIGTHLCLATELLRSASRHTTPHCTHRLEVKPLRFSDPGMGFVKDSVSYVWQISPSSESTNSKSGGLSLFKAPTVGRGAKKIEIAKYRSSSGKFEVGGVLAVEAHEIDVLVAVLTLCATLNQRDAFCMPGIGRVRSPSMVDGSIGMATPI